MDANDNLRETAPPIAASALTPAEIEQLRNDKLRGAIQRVLDRGGADQMGARYDRQHHRHNKA